MEELELIAIGIAVAAGLSIAELRCPMPGRVVLGLGLIGAAGGLLWALGLSITSSGWDFLQLDLGALLGVGVVDTWLGSV